MNEQKDLLSRFMKELPIKVLPNGHGHDLSDVLQLAVRNELTAYPTGFPKAILMIFSLDAKSIFKAHYTQASIRWESATRHCGPWGS